MSTPTDEDDLWRGTSDAPALLRARASTTPAQRLAWLEESLLLAQASGALTLERARRQQLADSWEPPGPRP
ncbi:hypothetical protein [Ornithinimicrobium cerasi]|uniref:Uncharacterized protein n=1 Tax=Ornithinimicrobium cerasi TaxID=2248773 RepID=A0A285VI80_9MICO|nr:hypothetical protein [Ornithinimicrobium cerasi]SOC53750.1 hypothetical protein SAMN05421879_102108 [Ornithinimicrobium cerasi]